MVPKRSPSIWNRRLPVAGLVAILLLSFGFNLGLHKISGHKKTIGVYFRDKGIAVKDVDWRIIETGPYSATRGGKIYRVETSEGPYWFRFGRWRSEPKIQKESVGLF